MNVGKRRHETRRRALPIVMRTWWGSLTGRVEVKVAGAVRWRRTIKLKFARVA